MNPPKCTADCGNRERVLRLRQKNRIYRELLREFIRHTGPLADLAGSKWAEEQELSQSCHGLNVTSKEAKRALEGK